MYLFVCIFVLEFCNYYFIICILDMFLFFFYKPVNQNIYEIVASYSVSVVNLKAAIYFSNTVDLLLTKRFPSIIS